MAKSKEKRSSGAGASQTDKSSRGGDPKISSEENFISLDAGALANLTQKIEQRLKNPNGTANKPQKPTGNSTKADTKKEPRKTSAEKKAPNPKTNQGKKRNRNGDVIDKPGKDGKTTQVESEDDILRKEILALGGSKEDFDLLENVNSDSEVEESATGQNKKAGSDEDALKKELAKLLKDAGQYNPEIPDDQVTDEEEPESEGEGESEGDEDEDVIENSSDDEDDGEESRESTHDNEKKKKNAAAETQSQFPKEYSRLVSFSAGEGLCGSSLIDL